MKFFLIFLGETNSPKFVHRLRTNVKKNCGIWNVYGPAETTMLSTMYLIDFMSIDTSVSIGRPLANYQCKILDVFAQTAIIDQEGELYVGAVGVFAGYLGRDDLSTKALIKMDGEIFYRTGDLVRMNNNGLLHYVGRKDFQIKLHGQRIELGEIERCLLDTSISACIVIKWGNDHLVAYVQSSDIHEKQLREHCQSRLPPHMIPSIFIVLEKLPLNVNGKIDRKLLPEPDLSSLTLSSPTDSNTPHNQLQQHVHDVWCQVLQCNEKQISINVNFFSIGGHSLLFIELYHRYQSIFGFDSGELSIAPFLQQPTILQHSQLLQTVTINHTKLMQWHTLHINQGNNF
jgi:hypothetical protein